jgi:glycerol-3-phosphate acyltransferase PlsY
LAWKAVLWLSASYLIGSIPFGLLVSRFVFGKDIRKMGSGNIGATNILRNFGFQPFLAVMLLDMAKGIAAVKIGEALGLPASLALAAGLLAIVGHNWSVYLRFKGGKGIATSGGVIIAAYPWTVTLSVVGVFLVMVLLTRIMSVGSLSAALVFPLSSLYFFSGDLGTYWPHVVVAVLACFFAFYRHRENIHRLFRGQEPRLSLRKAKAGGA